MKRIVQHFMKTSIVFKINIVLLFLLFSSLFYIYKYYHYRPLLDVMARENNLRKWHSLVEEFVSEQERLPISLYECCVFKKYIPVAYIGMYRGYPDDVDELLKDREYFNRVIEFTLLSGENSWFILEEESGRDYKKMLVIDHNKTLFSLSPSPLDDRSSNGSTSKE